MSCQILPDRHIDLVLSAATWARRYRRSAPDRPAPVVDPEDVAALTVVGQRIVEANRAAYRARYREEPPARVAPYSYRAVEPPAVVTAADVVALIDAVNATAYQLAEDVAPADAREVGAVVAWLADCKSALVRWLQYLVSPDGSHWIWGGGGDAARWAPSDGVQGW